MAVESGLLQLCNLINIRAWNILLLLLVICYVIYVRYGTPLRNVPGPFLASVTRLWKLRKILSGDFEWTNIDLHGHYGPIVRIGPNEVSIDDPDESLGIIYGHGTKFTKSPWYQASDAPGQHSIFTDTDIARHARERRLVANSFSMTSLAALEPYISDCVQVLETRLFELSKENAVVDVGHWLQCYAFDVIGEITFAKRFGFLDRGEDIGNIMNVLDGFLSYSSWMGVVPEFHAPFTKLMSTFFADGAPLESLRRFASNVVEKRQASETSHPDFVAHFLRIHNQKPDQFPMSEVYKMCMVLTGAGSDTTAIALRAVVYFLLKSPDKLEKLRSEIDQRDMAAEVSKPVTYSEAVSMPYLQAVLKEAMRLHPSTGFTLGRVVPAGGVVLLNHFIPENTVVGINSWVAHRNASVFGEDVESFRPERWLESEEATKRMDRYFLEFGTGSRTCLGKNISLMEMSKLVPEIFRIFDFDLVDRKKPWHTVNWWLVKQTGLLCRVRVRKNSRT
ncbi:cytochrome P450 oxidoreductase [Exophiala viscosa]|uniref:Cytochrome P450 oxidoreductase n=1 Tax=Exophiala viscosa TaxID=2486360 RepID=A0AAN6DUW2_9EURO|nr:cytochrome P450 oxidoreductase [Exophiala viscosa]